MNQPTEYFFHYTCSVPVCSGDDPPDEFQRISNVPKPGRPRLEITARKYTRTIFEARRSVLTPVSFVPSSSPQPKSCQPFNMNGVWASGFVRSTTLRSSGASRDTKDEKHVRFCQVCISLTRKWYYLKSSDNGLRMMTVWDQAMYFEERIHVTFTPLRINIPVNGVLLLLLIMQLVRRVMKTDEKPCACRA